MCGIGAIYDPSGSDSDRYATALLAGIRHRGPDGEDTYTDGPATLIHTRLAIIDLAGGDQPLFSEDRSVAVVVNGEIYNHEEIRRDLERRGHAFATHSDCEVVVHLYEEEGLAGFRRLNGMFAFALWDARCRRIVLVRDPLGVKPLYWWTDGRRIAAASEITALLNTGLVTSEVDPVALDHFLAWRFVPAPRTMFAGISKLAAASLLVVDEDGMRSESYREPPGAPFDDDAPEELEAELRERLIAAVQRQMMSDVPYGAFLSGGVDSAAVAASMRRAGPEPETFTVGFPGHGESIDEREAARESAREIGTHHRDTAMEAGDFGGWLARCVERLEEPCGIPSAPALLQLAAFTREHVKVVLSGQGADEPLGGYQRHQAAAALPFARRIPAPLAALGRAGAGLLPRNERAKRAATLLGEGDESAALLRIFEIAPPALRRELTGSAGEAAEAERARLAADVLADVAGRPLLDRALHLDTHLFLPDGLLAYGDKMTMAHALEQRVPFLDLELLRFVERVPGRLRVRRGRRKWLYREAMRGLVPESALNRTKVPFATPYDSWLRSELGGEVERAYAPAAPAAALARPETVGRLVAEHRTGRADHKRLLYCLLELGAWVQTFKPEVSRAENEV